jgi:hypothetical protein
MSGSGRDVKAVSQHKNPFGVSTPPVTVSKVPFSRSRYAFRTQKWFNLGTGGVLARKKTPPFALSLAVFARDTAFTS